MAAPRKKDTPRHHEPMGARIKGSRVRILDGGKPISVERLAARAGVTSNHLSRIERGEVMPRSETIASIADALGVLVSWLLTGKGRRVLRDGESNSSVRAA